MPPRLAYLAKVYDPQFLSSHEWIWGDPDLPNNLFHIVIYFEDEVIDQVFDVSGMDRKYPYVQDQFYGLHEQGILLIHQLKNHYSGLDSQS